MPVPEDQPDRRRRTVRLREEHDGPDHRYLDAYLDAEGNLHIDGQDLGPGTASVSSDGEYEWFKEISAAHVPTLRDMLGARADEDVLDVLERSWSGHRAGALETLLSESGLPIKFMNWSG